MTQPATLDDKVRVFRDILLEYNVHHDARGRFSSGGATGGGFTVQTGLDVRGYFATDLAVTSADGTQYLLEKGLGDVEIQMLNNGVTDPQIQTGPLASKVVVTGADGKKTSVKFEDAPKDVQNALNKGAKDTVNNNLAEINKSYGGLKTPGELSAKAKVSMDKHATKAAGQQLEDRAKTRDAFLKEQGISDGVRKDFAKNNQDWYEGNVSGTGAIFVMANVNNGNTGNKVSSGINLIAYEGMRGGKYTPKSNVTQEHVRAAQLYTGFNQSVIGKIEGKTTLPVYRGVYGGMADGLRSGVAKTGVTTAVVKNNVLTSFTPSKRIAQKYSDPDTPALLSGTLKVSSIYASFHTDKRFFKEKEIVSSFKSGSARYSVDITSKGTRRGDL